MKNNLKTLRQRMNMTQEELAKKVGTSTAYISQLESGKRNIATIRDDTRDRLVKALNCKPEDLIVESYFKFDERKNLIIDRVYEDPHNPNCYLIEYADRIYHLGQMSTQDGEETMKKLVPLKITKVPTSAKEERPVFSFMTIHCIPQKQIHVKLGKAVTRNELDHICKKYNITEMTDPFVASSGDIFGEKYKRYYTVVQVKIPSGSGINPVGIEEYLNNHGIEAINGSPDRVNIRIIPNEDAIDLAKKIGTSMQWNNDDCKKFCDMAGIDFDESNIETVVNRAADILGVEL